MMSLKDMLAAFICLSVCYFAGGALIPTPNGTLIGAILMLVPYSIYLRIEYGQWWWKS
jgi:hypothetical protein